MLGARLLCAAACETMAGSPDRLLGLFVAIATIAGRRCAPLGRLLFLWPDHNRIVWRRLLHLQRVVDRHATQPLLHICRRSVVMIENSVWSPMLGAFLVPRSPVQDRQIPAKKKGCLSARSNQRHSTAPFGVFLSGSENAVALQLGRQQPRDLGRRPSASD